MLIVWFAGSLVFNSFCTDICQICHDIILHKIGKQIYQYQNSDNKMLHLKTTKYNLKRMRKKTAKNTHTASSQLHWHTKQFPNVINDGKLNWSAGNEKNVLISLFSLSSLFFFFGFFVSLKTLFICCRHCRGSRYSIKFGFRWSFHNNRKKIADWHLKKNLRNVDRCRRFY